MTIGIVGRKTGMTRVFTEGGESIPVTVIECTPNRVTQVKTVENDGYRAVQVTVGEKKTSRINSAQTGHFKKAGVAPGRGLWEFRLKDGEGQDFAPGAEIAVGSFEGVARVDVTGTSLGKGFAGWHKRWNFGGGRASHGNSLSHRRPGSIGQRQSPGKVWKGKKMAGHMGNTQVTALNLDVVRIDAERNLLLVKGAVPGHKGADVVVCPTVKRR
jgi:large subunit ribosomal protein L3